MILESDRLSQFLCSSCVGTLCSLYKFRVKCIENQKVLRDELLTLENASKEEGLDVSEIVDHGDGQQNNSSSSTHPTRQDQDEKIKHTRSMSKRSSQHKTLMGNSNEPRSHDQCGKPFKSRASMLKHRKNHIAEKKSCTHCQFLPSSPIKLTQHMETEHSNLKNIMCTKCGKTFFKKANLRFHLLVHTGEKRHTCEICGLSFTLSGNLRTHRRLHTGEKPYICDHCGRRFIQHASLKAHEASHSTRKDHVCPECGAAFSRVGALRNHSKTHSENKPYMCSICRKGFRFSADRKRHMLIHSGIKNHVCEVCGKSFNRSSNLKVHAMIHTGETPHRCQICGKGFIQAHSFKSHLRTHKGNNSNKKIDVSNVES